MKYPVARLLVILSFFSCIIVHMLSPSLPVFSLSTGQVSAYYPNYFTPADYSFYIWTAIFFLMAAFTVYQYKMPDIILSNVSLTLVRICFIVYGVFNVIWLLSWYFYFIAFSAMTLFLITVFLGYICRVIYKSDLSTKDRLFIKIPFSVLYGWMGMTTVMNIVILMESIRWKNCIIPHFLWVLIWFVAVAIAAAIQIFMNKDMAYGLTFIWGYIGILVRHSLNGAENQIQYAIPVLIGCIIILTLSVIYIGFGERVLHKVSY